MRFLSRLVSSLDGGGRRIDLMEFGHGQANAGSAQHQNSANANNSHANPSAAANQGDAPGTASAAASVTRSSTPTQSQSPSMSVSVSTTPSKTRASSGRHRRSSGRTGNGGGQTVLPSAPTFMPNLSALAPPPRDQASNFLPPPPALAQLQGGMGMGMGMGLPNVLSGARRRSFKASPAQEENLSGESSNGGQDKDSYQVSKLNRLLASCPSPASTYRVQRSIGFGTFSTVYLAEARKEATATATSTASPSSSLSSSKKNSNKSDLPDRVAIKHLIPTSSPDRILMEVECLRLANGQENVIPLLFCHRKLGDIVLGMPFVETTKFVDALPSMTMEQCLLYMKNLLRALAYIHTLNIIHRDVKPANFLFDFQRNIFRLVDFGLAQASSEGDIKPPSPPTQAVAAPGTCKRALSARDPNAGAGGGNDASDKESPRKRARNAAAAPPKPPRTPTRAFTAATGGLRQEHYTNRGSVKKDLTPTSAKQSRTRQTTPTEPTPTQQGKAVTPQKAQNKLVEDMVAGGGESALPRRSPRKHSLTRKSSGFSKLTISGNAIVNATPAAAMASPAAVMAAAAAANASMKRTPSFTVLDPTSGIPSDCTPRLQARSTTTVSAILCLILILITSIFRQV